MPLIDPYKKTMDYYKGLSTPKPSEEELSAQRMPLHEENFKKLLKDNPDRDTYILEQGMEAMRGDPISPYNLATIDDLERDGRERVKKRHASTSSLGAFANTMSRVPENVLAKGLMAIQGQSGASVADQGYGDQIINWVEKRNRALAEQYRDTGDLIPGLISKQDLAELGPNLAFSGVSLLGSLAGGAAAAPIPVPGARIAGLIGGGFAAGHRMDSYMAMQGWLEKANKESIDAGLGPISKKAEEDFKKEFESLATEHGLWEGGAEGVGNVLELSLMAAKNVIPGGKFIPKGLMGKVAGGGIRAAGIAGTELGTESVTQMGQHNVEVKAGQTDEPLRKWTSGDDLLKSAKEVLPQVLLLTGFMTGGGAVYRKATGKGKEPSQTDTSNVDVSNQPTDQELFIQQLQTDVSDGKIGLPELSQILKQSRQEAPELYQATRELYNQLKAETAQKILSGEPTRKEVAGLMGMASGEKGLAGRGKGLVGPRSAAEYPESVEGTPQAEVRPSIETEMAQPDFRPTAKQRVRGALFGKKGRFVEGESPDIVGLTPGVKGDTEEAMTEKGKGRIPTVSPEAEGGVKRGYKVRINDTFEIKGRRGQSGVVSAKTFGHGWDVKLDDGSGTVIVPEKDLAVIEAKELPRITPEENKKQVSKYLKDNSDVEPLEELEDGDIVTRVIWDIDTEIDNNDLDLLSLPQGESVKGVHITDEPEFWQKRLAEDYDRENGTIIEIVAVDGDVLVDDPQYAIPEESGYKAHSAILVTGRKTLKRGEDFIVKGEEWQLPKPTRPSKEEGLKPPTSPAPAKPTPTMPEGENVAPGAETALTNGEIEAKKGEGVKEPWEMSDDEADEIMQGIRDKETLEKARPVLAAHFPEYDVENFRENDPWGIGRAIRVGDELPRVPRTELSKRHKAIVQQALKEGKPVPAEVLKDYPDLSPVATIKESLTVEPDIVKPKPKQAKGEGKAGVKPWDMTRAEREGWLDKKAEEYGSRNKFYASDEYKKIYPKLFKKQFQEEKEYKAEADKALKDAGLEPGNNVTYVSPDGQTVAHGNLYRDKKGVPKVKIHTEEGPQGKVSVNKIKVWHKGWERVAQKPTEAEKKKEDKLFNRVFKTERSAQRAIRNQLTAPENYKLVPIEGGFLINRKAPGEPRLKEIRTKANSLPFITKNSARKALKRMKKSEFDYDLVKEGKGFIWREKAEKPTPSQKLLLEDEKAAARRMVLMRNAKNIRIAIMHSSRLRLNDPSYKGEFADATKGPGAWPLSLFNNETGVTVAEMVDVMIEAQWLPKGATEQDLLDAIDQNITMRVSGEGTEEQLDKLQEEEYLKQEDREREAGELEDDIKRAKREGIRDADEETQERLDAAEREVERLEREGKEGKYDQAAIDELDAWFVKEQQSLFGKPEVPLLTPEELTKKEKLARAQDEARRKGLTKKGAKPVFQTDKGIKPANVGKQQDLFGAGQKDLFDEGIETPQNEQVVYDTVKPEEIKLKSKEKGRALPGSTRVRYRTSGRIRAQGNVVTNTADLASLLARLRTEPDEYFFAVAVDKKGTVLEIHEHAKGGRSAGAVFPDIVVGRALQVPGVAKVYFAHNHPSYTTKHSQPDTLLTKDVNRLLDIAAMPTESIIIGGMQYANLTPYGAGTPQKIKPVLRKTLLNKVKRRTARALVPKDKLSSSVDAKAYFKNMLNNEDGILLMTGQNHPVAFLPFVKGRTMRQTTIDLLKLAERTNSASFVIKDDTGSVPRRQFIEGLVAERLGGFQVLDVMHSGKSWADGELPGMYAKGSLGPEARDARLGSDVRLSTATTKTPKGIPLKRVQNIVNGIYSQLTIPGVQVRVLPGVENLGPDRIKRFDIDPEKQIVSGAFTQENGKPVVYIFADAMNSKKDVVDVAMEEILHYGVFKSLGKEYNSILNSIYKDNETAIKEALGTDYDIDLKTITGKSEAVDEWLTKSIVKDPSSVPDSVWHKIFRAIKRMLRKAGINVQYSIDEVKSMMVDAITQGAPDIVGTPQVAGMMASTRTYADPFYSQLIKVVSDNLKQMPAKVQSLTKWLQKKQVKPAELKWMGVEQWMKDNQKDGKIDREAFLEFLKANDIEVREVVKGEKSINKQDFDNAKKTLEDAGYEVIEESDGSVGVHETGEHVFPDGSKGPPQMALRGSIPEALKKSYDIVEDYSTQESDDYYNYDVAGRTKFKGYQLSGGENYREMVFVLPDTSGFKAVPHPTEKGFAIQKPDGSYVLSGPESVRPGEPLHWETEEYLKQGMRTYAKDKYQSQHWDEPNVLAHVRWNERTDAEGNRVLFVEEVQSDALQQAKEHGFKGDETLPPGVTIGEYEFDGTKLYVAMKDGKRISSGYPSRSTVFAELRGTSEGLQVPKMPFLENWPEYVMKRMLRYAAQNGFDKVAWTKGKHQIDRYNESLRQNVDEIRWEKSVWKQGEAVGYKLDTDDSRYVVYDDQDNFIVSFQDEVDAKDFVKEKKGMPRGDYVRVTASKEGDEKFSEKVPLKGTTTISGKEVALKDVVGKPIAQQIVASTQTSGTVKGDDLSIGGMGMRSFYDELLPGFLKKYGKQWGAKTSTIPVNTSETVGWRVLGNQGGMDTLLDTAPSKVEAEKLKAQYEKEGSVWAGNVKIAKPAFKIWDHVHAIDITDSMRESVLFKGQTKFSMAGKKAKTAPIATEEFKAKMKGSVVTKTGKPWEKPGDELEVYHGTGRVFDKFDKSLDSFWFTNEPEISDEVAMEFETPIVKPSYLSIKKPYITEGIPSSPAPNKFSELKKQGYDGWIDGETYIAFHPDQIISAFPETNITKAQKMLDEGKTEQEVWDKTGWVKEASGKWMFRIDDSGAKLKPNLNGDGIRLNEIDPDSGVSDELLLEDVLDHPLLFKAYPQLKTTKVRRMMDEKVTASYDGNQNAIYMGLGYFSYKGSRQVKTALLHEIQHAIQEIEGFARGGSGSQYVSVWGMQKQDITSADTSINAKRLPASFKKIKFQSDTINADIGGGRFDNATEYLKTQKVDNVIVDPFNRTLTYNQDAIGKIKSGKSDTATINNVLNVVRGEVSRSKIIAQAADAIKEEGSAYFLIHEGDKTKKGKKTTKGWQENRPSSDYIIEIEKYFADVIRKGNMLIATGPIKDEIQKQLDFVGYKHLAGEIYAREAGAQYTGLPGTMEGIPKDQWIVKDGTGTSFSVEQPEARPQTPEEYARDFLKAYIEAQPKEKQAEVGKKIKKEEKTFDKQHLKDATDTMDIIRQFLKVRKQGLKKTKVDVKSWERLLSVPSHFFHKIEALGRVFMDGLQNVDNRHIILDGITMANDGHYFTVEIDNFRKQDKAGYRKYKRYLKHRDQNGIGYSIGKNLEGGWDLFAVKAKEDAPPIATFMAKDGISAEQQAVDAMIQAEANDYRKSGASDQAVNALIAGRRITNNGFDILFQAMRDLEAHYKEQNLEMPTETVNVDGKAVSVNLKLALAKMGSIRGYYMPRIRKPGRFVVFAKKEGSHPIRQHFELKTLADAWAARKRTQGYTTTVERQKRMIEDVFEMAGQVVAQEAIINEALRNISPKDFKLEDFNLKIVDRKVGPGKRDFMIDGPTTKDMNAVFKKMGGRWRPSEGNSGPKVWHFQNPGSHFESRLAKALAFEKAAGKAVMDVDTEVKAVFAKALVEQVSNIIKGRGVRSHMIQRVDAKGMDVWEGYEEDPGIALGKYARSVSAGEAKKIMARDMLAHFTGTDISWKQFQQLEGEDVTYEDYLDFVEERRVDPVNQENGFKEGKSYMEHMLRNEEAIDRLTGTIKGIAVLKYLGGRVSAPLVNLTALVTSVPASMNGFGNIPIHKTFGYIGKASKLYGKYKFGNKKALPKDIQLLFDEIHEKGWHNAQYNREALAVLRGKAGRGWDKLIDWSMIGFGVTEQLNRVSTIAGAYLGLKAQGRTDHDAMMELAKKISDRAHATYGKANWPSIARGSHPAAQVMKAFYVFRTFSHNYMLTMKALWGEGWTPKQGKAFSYMALSPAVLAGAGGVVGWDLIMKAIGMAIDSDDPEDDMYKWLEANVGDYAENLARFGGFGLIGMNLKGSLEIGVTDLPTTWKDLLGAPGSVITDFYEGGKNLMQGNISKGIEKLSPLATAGPFKAYREATEGLTTRTNAPIFYGRERVKADMTDAILRAFSFNPAGITKIREEKWAERKQEQAWRDRKTKINSRIKKFYLQPVEDRNKADSADILEDIREYNERIKRKKLVGIIPFITYKTIRRDIRRSFKPTKREIRRRRAVNE